MKCQVLVDWLTFSVKTDNVNKVISDYLGMDPALFQDLGYGLLGYQKCLGFNDIVVCYEGRENDYFRDMGVCVSMSGNGCRTFETMSRLPDQTAGGPFPVLFQKLAGDLRVNVSRIDIACDDREGRLDMQEIIKKTYANDINSRMAKRQVVVSMDGTQRDGSTVYIGSPSSDFRLRIYDKALEQGESGPWIRVEMVMRSKNARGFVDQVVNSSVGELAARVLNDKFSFINRDDSNISRCSVCSWWSSFVDDLESVRLVARQVVQHTVQQIAAWVDNQVAPSLSIIARSLGWDYLVDLVHRGRRRLSSKQESIVSDYNSFVLHIAG